MKKVLLVSLVTLGLVLITTPVIADMLVIDIDPPSINPTYWIGNDVNVIYTIPNQGQLVNSNENTEEAWLEGLLGLTYNSPLVGNPRRILAGQSGIGSDDKQLFNYNPGFAWDYVVIKYDNNWIAYMDTDNDNILTTDVFRFGISHATFFGGQPIPEPATMLLLGSGLIGLAGVVRKKFKK